MIWRVVRLSSLGLFLLALACGSRAKVKSTADAEPGPPKAPAGRVAELVSGEPATSLAVEVDDPRLGSEQASVTIVAFLDYQCPFCRDGFLTLLELRKEYSAADLRIVFKHLPLSFHEFAVPAAIAGQAVMQGAGSEAFFRFSRLAFEHQSELGYEELARWAEESGLPREYYNELVSSEETLARIAQDAQLATSIGVDSTPAFFINGLLLAGAQPKEVFQDMIGEELKEMKELAAGQEALTWRDAYRKRVAGNVQGSVLDALLESDPQDYRVPVDDSPVLGPENAPVTLVMFTDFECPYCKRAEQTLHRLIKKYPDDLRVVFKHLPLPFHESARPAAQLAAAVAEYSGTETFFSAAKAIFEKSPHLARDSLEQIGRTHGLTKQQIDRALSGADEKVNTRLQKDLDLADDVLARGTPHFFINGKRLTGARPLEHFEALVEYGNSRAQKLLSAGVAPEQLYAELQEDALSPGLPEKLDTALPTLGRPIKGLADAPISIHVFSDFQCPYCRAGEETLQQLARTFPGKLRFVWHDFPLDFHERARPAARAAREAFQQKGNDAFWKMHDLLFGFEKEQAQLTDADIERFGKQLGLDLKALRAAVKDTEHDPKIDAEIELGKARGIRGTPAYVVDGYLVTGAKPLRYFERVVKMALEDRRQPAQPAPAD